MLRNMGSTMKRPLERAKHSFFALPNPLSCPVMNKICLNQETFAPVVRFYDTVTTCSTEKHADSLNGWG